MSQNISLDLRERILKALPGIERLTEEELSLASIATLMRGMTAARRRVVLRKLGDELCERLFAEWAFWARVKQLWDPTWKELVVLWMTGRGFGKTRCGAETVNLVAEYYPDMCGGEIALIGQTATDMRDIMVEGKSGIMATAKPWFVPVYEPSKMKITWPNGVIARLRTSEKPKLIRGLSVGLAWCDEIAHWFDPEEAWGNLLFALREGNPSHVIATTTPLPTKFVRELAADPGTRVIHGTSHENAAHLDANFLPNLEKKFGGSKKGRQEIGGEIVEDNENAPFKTDHIGRIRRDEMPKLAHLAVGIDPAGGTTSKNSDETGVIAMGIDIDGNLYVLGDRSADVSSAKWTARGVDLAMVLRADYSVDTAVTIVGEVNFGGDMVERCIKTTPKWGDSGLRFEAVKAFVDKATRADPIALQAELGRYYHTGTGTQYRDLEGQMTQFDPTLPRKKQASPDRMDAMVHVATFLLARLETGGKRMKQLDAAQMAKIRQKIASGYSR